MSREDAYTALFAVLEQVATTPALKTVDRRVQLLDNMQPGALPALFMAVGSQQTVQQRGLPPKRTLTALVYLYAANPDRHTAAGIVLNGMIDAVEAAIAPAPAFDTQTLGGIVSHCWIEGEIEVFEGALGEKAAAIVPIRMMIP